MKLFIFIIHQFKNCTLNPQTVSININVGLHYKAPFQVEHNSSSQSLNERSANSRSPSYRNRIFRLIASLQHPLVVVFGSLLNQIHCCYCKLCISQRVCFWIHCFSCHFCFMWNDGTREGASLWNKGITWNVVGGVLDVFITKKISHLNRKRKRKNK